MFIMLEVILLRIDCSFLPRDYLIMQNMMINYFHSKCNVLAVIMASDKAKVAKKGGEDPGPPPASREGENSHEPQRQRSLNG